MKHQEELVDRLGRFYREARLEVPTAPPAWVTPERKRRYSWQPVLASAGLAAIVVSLFFGVRLARDRAAQVRATASPSVSAVSTPSATSNPTATAAPTPTPSLVPAANWITQRFSIGAVSNLLLDPAGVFALYVPGPANGRTDPALTRIARIDRGTGAKTAGETLPYASALSRVDGGLWIGAGSGAAPPPTSGSLLTLIDPANMQVKRRVTVPGHTGSESFGPQLAGSGGTLWLANGDRLYRLNPDTGVTLLTKVLPGWATDISLDPTNQRLYVGIEVPPSAAGQDLVVELDASTGATLASVQTGGGGLGGPHVVGAPGGVWVAYATGTMGLVEHRRASNLSQVGNPVRTSNSSSSVFGANVLWLVDRMAQQLSCSDPATGATRASSPETLIAALAVDAGGAYLGDSEGVAALQPPASCRG